MWRTIAVPRCDLPRAEAPDMFRLTENQDHCYVYQQPQTEDQLRRMIDPVADRRRV